MMTTLEQPDEGCLIGVPINRSPEKKKIIGFVDDKQQYTNNWLHNCLDTATNNLHEVVQGWEHLLHTTERQLELTKYAWYCISWAFIPDGLHIMTNNNNHTIRIISSANLSTVNIKQLPITSSFKYLGVDNTSSSNQTKHLQTLMMSSQRGVRIFTSSKLNHSHIGMYLKTHISPNSSPPCLFTFINLPIQFYPTTIYELSNFIDGLQ